MNNWKKSIKVDNVSLNVENFRCYKMSSVGHATSSLSTGEVSVAGSLSGAMTR